MTYQRTVLAATGALLLITLGSACELAGGADEAAELQPSPSVAEAPEPTEDWDEVEAEAAPTTASDSVRELAAAPAEPADLGQLGGQGEGGGGAEVANGWGSAGTLGRTGGAPARRARRPAPARPGAFAPPQPSPQNHARGRRANADLDDPWGPAQNRSPRATGRVAAAPPAAAQPLPQNGVLASTFVGGSGAQARLEDLLDRGVMVGGENVRLEAFDELGRLPYAVPGTEAVGLHAELERSQLLTGGERVHLQIALMAHQGEAPPRPRMDVRLVMDRSGSMTGEKWNHAMAAARQLLQRLRPTDTFGLISYSDDASVDHRPARVGNGAAALRAINRLEPGGGTNIEAALRAVAANAPRRRAMNDVLLVVLVSDGVANIGQTNSTELGQMARSIFDEHGALTTSVGLGTDFDESTMLAIAREGSGSYHFVRRPADIADILTDELEERAQAVAQALRLRIELGEGVRATRVYGSRVLDEQEEARVRHTEVATDRRLAAELGIARDRQRDEDRGLRIHLPSFRRGDQHVVLMELEVPRGTDTSRIAHVTLDYKDLLSRGNRTAEVDVDAERTSDRQAAIASTRRPVKRTVLAFTAGDALHAASEALSRGDHAAARTVLAERRRVLVAAADLWHDDALRADADLLGRYDRVLGAAWGGWDGGSRRTMMMAMSFYGDRRMR